MSVLLGNGDGSFQATVFFGAGDITVSVADLDGDTFPDLVTANRFSDDVGVLLNLPEPRGSVTLIAGAAFLDLLCRWRVRR